MHIGRTVASFGLVPDRKDRQTTRRSWVLLSWRRGPSIAVTSVRYYAKRCLGEVATCVVPIYEDYDHPPSSRLVLIRITVDTAPVVRLDDQITSIHLHLFILESSHSDKNFVVEINWEKASRARWMQDVSCSVLSGRHCCRRHASRPCVACDMWHATRRGENITHSIKIKVTWHCSSNVDTRPYHVVCTAIICRDSCVDSNWTGALLSTYQHGPPCCR